MNENNSELLEIYKLHAELADRVSQRRTQTNHYFISIISGIITLLALVFQFKGIEHGNTLNWFLFGTGMFGFVLCFAWLINLNSYRQLNSAKFKALNELESKLAFPFYQKEWEAIKREKDAERYISLSSAEKTVPTLLMVPYGILLVYSMIQMFS